uniref:C-type lectin domain-containing protein n=1 Tax=Acrobeloides nanus TaxID=290746 RepID=A0A914D3N5_9BILA
MFQPPLFFLSFFLFFQSNFASCPSWTKEFNQKCYYFSSPNDTTNFWYTAENKCNCLGGHLISIDNVYENYFITSNSVGTPWIGAIWVSNGINYTWSDGHNITYSNWAAGQPNAYNWCTKLLPNGTWTNESCIGYNNYICQIPPNGLNCPKPQLSNSSFASYWTYFDGKVNNCYKTDPDFYRYLGDINQTCTENNVLSIHSAEEQAVLRDWVKYYGFGKYVFTGLYDPHKNGSWTWLDGTSVDFTAWAPGEPRYPGTLDCAFFGSYKDDFAWVTMGCSDDYFIPVCKRQGKPQNDMSFSDVCSFVP